MLWKASTREEIYRLFVGSMRACQAQRRLFNATALCCRAKIGEASRQGSHAGDDTRKNSLDICGQASGKCIERYASRVLIHDRRFAIDQRAGKKRRQNGLPQGNEDIVRRRTGVEPRVLSACQCCQAGSMINLMGWQGGT